MPAISLVVVSKDEVALGDTLRHLTATLDPARVEVVVVDASEGRLDGIAASHPAVRWVPFTPVAGRRTTIPHQRNVGLAAATADVVAFVDCGCEPAPDWLSSLTAPLLDRSELVTCGPVRSRRPVAVGERDAEDGTFVPECPTINMALRREVWDLVGGFDEWFHYGSDMDFSWRIVESGVRIRFVAAAAVTVDWGDARRRLRRSYRYGEARARLYRKHWRRLPRAVLTDRGTFVYPVFLLTLPLAYWRRARLFPLAILVPLYRNRDHLPLQVMGHHLALGAGVLRGLTGLPLDRRRTPEG